MAPPGARQPPAADVLASLTGSVVRPRLTLRYRLSVALTALLMLLLPGLYLALVFGAAWLFLYAIPYVAITTKTNPRGSVVLLAFSLTAGVTLVFFMVKPLLARRPKPSAAPQPLDRDQAPLLFAFVERLCEVLGAPLPARIYVDVETNASASLGAGWGALFRNRPHLRIGLPLVAHFSVRQLAGVLAHELGHFSQGSSMRLTRVIDSINVWFAQVVYARDAWDERLEHWSKSLDLRLALILKVVRGLVWCTRRVLWLLMMAGFAVSRYTSRQMEFDADRYEAAISGSDVFAKTTKELSLLSEAKMVAHNDLSNMWSEGRLVDNLPELMVTSAKQLDAAALALLAEREANQETGYFDTHPSARERVAHVQKYPTKGLCTDERPARILLGDFDALCRATTLHLYRENLGEGVTQAHLISTSQLERTKKLREAQYTAGNSYFGGGIAWPRAVGIARLAVARNLDPKSLAKGLRVARGRMVEARRQYDPARGRFSIARERLATGVAAVRALGANLQVPQEFFNTPYLITIPDVQQVIAQAKREIADVERLLVEFETSAVQRLGMGLSLLLCPQVAAQVKESARVEKRLAALLPVAKGLEEAMPQLATLDMHMMQLHLMIAVANHKNEETGRRQDVRPLLADQLPSMARDIDALYVALERLLYPFEHAEGIDTVGRYALPIRPNFQEMGEVYDAASQMLDRLGNLYIRVLAGLAKLAVRAEVAIGLPDPNQPAADGQAAAAPEANAPPESGNRQVATSTNNAAGAAQLQLSEDKVRVLEPTLYPGNDLSGLIEKVRYRKALRRCKEMLKEHMLQGDCRAALVVSIAPLRVAAYSDAFDAVVLLEFPQEFVRQYGLKPGSRLLSVQMFYGNSLEGLAPDIRLGPRATGRFENFAPLIAEFLSDDIARIRKLKAQISEEEWQRCAQLAREYVARHGHQARLSRPLFANYAAFAEDRGSIPLV